MTEPTQPILPGGLFTQPVLPPIQSTARDDAKAVPEPSAKTLAWIVNAWAEAASTREPVPPTYLHAHVATSARVLLAQGRKIADVIAAAEAAGRAGWTDVVRGVASR